MREPTVLRYYNSCTKPPIIKLCLYVVSCYNEVDVIVDVALQNVLQKGRLDFEEPNSMVVMIRPLGSNREANRPFARNVTLSNH